MGFIHSKKSRNIVSIVIILSGIITILYVRKPHILEFANYYFGAKYFKEVGYFNLYDDFVGAISNIYGKKYVIDNIHYIRYLGGLGYESSQDAINRFEKNKHNWKPYRWKEFLEDTRQLDKLIGENKSRTKIEHWARILIDHGYNATPVYTAYVSPLVNMIPLTSNNIYILCSFDVILVILIFILLYKMKGLFYTAMAFLFFASAVDILQYITWALFRFDWILALAIALYFIRCKKFFLSGLFWGISSTLRIFPFYIALFFFLVWLISKYKSKNERKYMGHFIIGIFGGCILSIAYSFISLKIIYNVNPFLIWSEFIHKITNFSIESKLANAVGLGKILELIGIPNANILEFLLAILIAVSFSYIIIKNKYDTLKIAVMSIFFIPLFFYLSHYYYIILIFPAALCFRETKYVYIALIIVNIITDILKLYGLKYLYIINFECYSYSIILVSFPIITTIYFWRKNADRQSGKRLLKDIVQRND